MTRQQGVYDFNETVAADLLTVHDVDGTAYEVLSLVAGDRVTTWLRS
jgi:hypothetical protein